MPWAPDYATAAELAAYMRIGDSLDNVELARAVSAASRAVDQVTGRQFGQVAAPEERFYRSRWDPREGSYMIDVDDLTTAVGLVVAGVAAAEVIPGPRNSVVRGRAWYYLRCDVAPTVVAGDVSVTARWGWATVPAAVAQATLTQAARLVMRRDSPFGVTGSPEQGSEMRLLAKVDPDVEVALRPYRRVWGAA